MDLIECIVKDVNIINDTHGKPVHTLLTSDMQVEFAQEEERAIVSLEATVYDAETTGDALTIGATMAGLFACPVPTDKDTAYDIYCEALRHLLPHMNATFATLCKMLRIPEITIPEAQIDKDQFECRLADIQN